LKKLCLAERKKLDDHAGMLSVAWERNNPADASNPGLYTSEDGELISTTPPSLFILVAMVL
jgi:hypothetical protein